MGLFPVVHVEVSSGQGYIFIFIDQNSTSLPFNECTAFPAYSLHLKVMIPFVQINQPYIKLPLHNIYAHVLQVE